MASEMEDFLRRAAQRRAENAAERSTRSERAQPPRRPEYTDRDRERVSTSSDADDDIVIADLVQTQPVEDRQERQERQERQRRQSQRPNQPNASQSNQGQSNQSQSNQSQPNLSPSSLSQSGLGQTSLSPSGPGQSGLGPSNLSLGSLTQGGGMLGEMQRSVNEAAAAAPANTPALQALLRLMTDPNGIDQAILAREILDRPTHRWR